MNLAKHLLIAATGIFAAVSLTGCALTKDYVSFKYAPQTNVVAIAGAEKVAVKVGMSDLRAIRDKVGTKKNGYGVEMAPIIAKEDVNDTVKNAIHTELKNRGFRLGDGDITVLVELTKFYNDFKMGFWAGDAAAEVMLSVQIKKGDGNILYSKSVIGEGLNPNIQLASGHNAQIALEAALQNAVARLFGDPLFVDGLIKGSKTSSALVALPQPTVTP